MTNDPCKIFTFAQFHGHIAQHPIFRPLPKMPFEKRPSAKMKFSGAGKNPYTLQVESKWQLDYHDQSVLAVLLAICAPDHRGLEVEPRHTKRASLKEDAATGKLDTMSVEVNLRELLQLLEWSTTGQSYTRLGECLKRLQNTILNYGPKRGDSHQTHLIGVLGLIEPTKRQSFDKKKERQGPITVVLSSLLASVILKKYEAGVIIHHLSERRLLSQCKKVPCQVALGLYSQLVCLVKQGGREKFQLQTLLRRIYALEKDSTGTTDQRKDVLKTINHWPLEKWSFEIEGRAKDARVWVNRPEATPA